jgi:hypothetical protein
MAGVIFAGGWFVFGLLPMHFYNVFLEHLRLSRRPSAV